MGRKIIVCQTQRHRRARAQHLPSQCQPLPCGTPQAAEKIAATHIGKQADVGLRHTQLTALCDDAHARTLADAHAAPHHDAIHKRQVRLGVGMNQVVEGVLLSKKFLQNRVASQRRLVKKPDVATGAKHAKRTLAPHPADGHSGDVRVIAPAQQRGRQCADHRQRQGVESLGSVQR